MQARHSEPIPDARCAKAPPFAVALYRELGFKDEGRMRDHIIRDDIRDDVVIMGLLRGELNSPTESREPNS